MEDASESVDSYVFKSSGRGFGCTGSPVIPVVFLTTCWNRGRVKRNILWDVCRPRTIVRWWRELKVLVQFLLSSTMASIALHQTRRTLFPALRSPWATPAIATALLPTFLASQQPFNWAMPTLQSLLDLLPPFLLAVPKKKVSHSRKAMRSSNKGLKDKRNIVSCPACGQPKLAHHLCADCFSSFSRRWKGYVPYIHAPYTEPIRRNAAPNAPPASDVSGQD